MRLAHKQPKQPKSLASLHDVAGDPSDAPEFADYAGVASCFVTGLVPVISMLLALRLKSREKD